MASFSILMAPDENATSAKPLNYRLKGAEA